MPSNKTGEVKKQKMSIEHRLLSDKVTEVLRQNIIVGKFPPGFRLIEEDLTDTLGVSRACIREAVMQLENEGLVSKKLGRREVISFQKADYEEIYMLRLYIEKLAIATCLANGTMPISILLKKSGQITKLVDKKPIDYVKLTEADLSFHEAIVSASGNRRAIKVWHDLENQIKTLLFLYFSTSQQEPSIDDDANHMQLVKYLQSEDKAKIDEYFESHILSGLKMLLR